MAKSSSKGQADKITKKQATSPAPPSMVLDNSIVASTADRFPYNEGSVLGQSMATFNSVTPGGELIIEVELAPGASILGAAQTTMASRSIGGNASSDANGTGLLLDLENALRGAKPVFTEEQIQVDEAQLRVANQGMASPNQVNMPSQLPSRASYVRLQFPAGTAANSVIDALRKLPEINRAVVVPQPAPPLLTAINSLPTDPLIGINNGPITVDPQTKLESQWYLHRTRVPQAWRYARGAGVVLADIDWGFRITHQDLENAIELTYNAVDGQADVTQGSHASHGTAVVGIAGARSNNIGMAGYAPEATIWAIQGNSAPTPKRFEDPWVEAIDFVRRTDAQGQRKVIILEVQSENGGNYEQIPSIHREIRAAISEGCVVCVAAGNGNRPADRSDQGELFDPTGSILVGATSYHEQEKINRRASFSNFGNRVVISAPGDPAHDLTCGHSSDNSYVNTFGGTSGATPKVAGTVALMLSVNPNLSHNDVRDILAGTGSPITEEVGKPIGVFLNAEAAVAEALRRSLETPQETLILAEDPILNDVPKLLQGMRRRKSQRILPKEGSSVLDWEIDEEQTSTGSNEETTALLEGNPPTGDTTLRLFRETKTGTLTQQDRILIVGQAIQMLDNFYVHRPLKEAIHGIRPIQRLRVLQRRLQRQVDIPVGEHDELTFHNTLTQIFNSFRDLHTGYQLPSPYRYYIAYLPFEVAAFTENGRQHYVVTRVMPRAVFEDTRFGVGAEILYWNGMVTTRAIQSNADQTAGGNEAARLARGLSALTIRPMNTALPPEADFVDIEFVLLGSDASDATARHRMRQHWYVRYAPATVGGHETATKPPQVAPQARRSSPVLFEFDGATDLLRESTVRASTLLFDDVPPPVTQPVSPPSASTKPDVDVSLQSWNAALGLDIAADDVREARQLIFEPDISGPVAMLGFGASGQLPTDTTADIAIQSPWNVAFRTRTINIDGKLYGYIHIRTFYVQDADGFIQEFIRLLSQLPEQGLVLDVRGNGGGSIWAAERLLQTLTAVEIDPERLQFISTPGTLDLTRNNPETAPIPLNQWLASLEEAVETGSIYSRPFPLTAKESCNNIGQKYYGPVVLVIDANCYSATDIFAAGFQDHRIGKVLGVSATTGAGGANVWEHQLLAQTLPLGWGLKPLPNGVGMRVAIRQCLRVGSHAGELLEDFGVVPDAIHLPTRGDILESDKDLLAQAAQLLAAEATRSLQVTVDSGNNTHSGKRHLTIKTHGLTRLDFYINGRPETCQDLTKEEDTLPLYIQIGATLRLLGYNDVSSVPIAMYQGKIA